MWFQKGKCTNGSACTFQHVQQERDANIVVVRNLPKSQGLESLELELMEHFKPFGYIARIQVKTDLDNRCRGFAFVVFSDARSSDEALRCGHPMWNIKRKTELPMLIEGDTRVSRKTTVQLTAPLCSGPFRLPFTSRDRVLLVGEGNFSFCVAAIVLGHMSPSSTLATSREPPREAAHLQDLTRRGVRCHTDVDATTLSLAEKFDVVVFNFPHTGEPSVEANIGLLRAFFRSAPGVLLPGGRVAVTLKQTWPYNEWALEASAAAEGLRVLDSYLFPARVLCENGYSHATTDYIPHQVDHLRSAKVFEFGIEDDR